MNDVDGLTFKTTSRGICVAYLDYWARADRDEVWAKRMEQSLDEEQWLREFRRFYGVVSGQVVLKVDPGIHFKKLNWIPGKVMWRGWDFGYRRPACMVTQMNNKDQWCWYWGMVGENEITSKFAARVFEICDAKYPAQIDKNGKKIEQLWLDYCDPHVNSSSVAETTDAAELEAAYKKRYKDRHMSLAWARLSFEDGIKLMRERLLLRNDGNPGLLIDDDFQLAKDGVLGGYHFPEDRKSGEHPEYPAKDGTYIHLMDSARYIAACEFESYEATKKDDRKWPEPWLDDVPQPLLQHAGY